MCCSPFGLGASNSTFLASLHPSPFFLLICKHEWLECAHAGTHLNVMLVGAYRVFESFLGFIRAPQSTQDTAYMHAIHSLMFRAPHNWIHSQMSATLHGVLRCRLQFGQIARLFTETTAACTRPIVLPMHTQSQRCTTAEKLQGDLHAYCEIKHVNISDHALQSPFKLIAGRSR